MYQVYEANQGNPSIIDRREMVRVKIKSLAIEAQQIRSEERKLKALERWRNRQLAKSGIVGGTTFPYGNTLREEMYHHRIGVVRYEARHAHLAYGFIRGLTYEKMEPVCYTAPNWDRVRQILKKYGPRDFVEPEIMSKTVKVKERGPKAKRVRPTNQEHASAQGLEV